MTTWDLRPHSQLIYQCQRVVVDLKSSSYIDDVGKYVDCVVIDLKSSSDIVGIDRYVDCVVVDLKSSSYIVDIDR
jgi:hypothetical protein